jgi:hypothetical protein
MKKILLVTQEELAHKNNEIVEMINFSLIREFTQTSREFTQISAETTRIKVSYRLRDIHSIESLREKKRRSMSHESMSSRKSYKQILRCMITTEKRLNTIFLR